MAPTEVANEFCLNLFVSGDVDLFSESLQCTRIEHDLDYFLRIHDQINSVLIRLGPAHSFAPTLHLPQLFVHHVHLALWP